jgi:WD40 repeat protein
MHVGEIGGEEVLVTTDDSGHIAVHFPRDDFSRPPLTLEVVESAWGIDTHSSKRLLAISCNAHFITIFHLGMGIDGWTWTTEVVPGDEGIPKIELLGHKNNIPTVAFDQTGDRLASGSLDNSVMLWNCRTGQMLENVDVCARYIHTTISNDSVWAVRFVNTEDFKHYQRTEQGIPLPIHY